MVIEFLGLPGSGKTTLCEALVARLVAEGRAVRVRAPLRAGPLATARRTLGRLGAEIGSIARAPRRGWPLLRAIGRSDQRSRTGSLRLCRGALFLLSERFPPAAPDTWQPLDQGFAQLALSIAYDAGRDAAEIVREVLEAAPVADRYVLVEVAGAHVSLERLRGRPVRGGRITGEGERDSARLQAMAALLEVVVEALERRGARVVRVRADDGAAPEALASALLATLRTSPHGGALT